MLIHQFHDPTISSFGRKINKFPYQSKRNFIQSKKFKFKFKFKQIQTQIIFQLHGITNSLLNRIQKRLPTTSRKNLIQLNREKKEERIWLKNEDKKDQRMVYYVFPPIRQISSMEYIYVYICKANIYSANKFSSFSSTVCIRFQPSQTHACVR